MEIEKHPQEYSRQEQDSTDTIPVQAIVLLRDELISNLFDRNAQEILYWAGKELARKTPLKTDQGLLDFFIKAGFGNLEKLKKTKNQVQYLLDGPIVAARMENHDPSFSLEAGFLSQQHELIHSVYTEAVFEVNRKKKQVILLLQTDRKEDSFL